MQYSDLFCEKYRPQTFDDVVMDDNVRILIKSIFDKEDPVIPNLWVGRHLKSMLPKKTESMICEIKLSDSQIRYQSMVK